jgi:hypothetical protein
VKPGAGIAAWGRVAAWVGLAAAGMSAAACADALLPPDPAADPVAVARAAWEEVDQYYPWFALKGVDWDAVGGEYLPRVTSATTDADLFATLTGMLSRLRDGHLSLDSPGHRYAWDGWYADYPVNYAPFAAAQYFQAPVGAARGGVVSWARLRERVGYIRIPSFDTEGVGDGVDAALSALAAVGPIDGIVIDVRSNGGGSDTQSEAAAGRFLDEAAVYRRIRYKAGPGHEDFGPELTTTVSPQGAQRFTGPVVVLQNRGVFSAAEDFVLAMRTRADVTFIGDTTGGGSGNPLARELPNGWILAVPRWRQFTPDGRVYEGIGLAPDLFASTQDPASGEDRILERAIQFLVRTP